MNEPGPWTFGWNQSLAIGGMLVTIGIAIGGFRTFGRWRRERLEEAKIQLAFEALALAYETEYVFKTIRTPMAYPYEWSEMPTIDGESQDERSRRGTFYATLKRIEAHKEFFERIWKLQPRFMAVFGPESKEVFMHLHQARRFIEVSAAMLARPDMRVGQDWNQNRRRQHNQMEADVWEGMDEVHLGTDRVQKGLKSFEGGIVRLCRPIVNQQYRAVRANDGKKDPAGEAPA